MRVMQINAPGRDPLLVPGELAQPQPQAGEVLIRELKRRTAKALELASLDASGPDRALASDEVEWIARIAWTRH